MFNLTKTLQKLKFSFFTVKIDQKIVDDGKQIKNHISTFQLSKLFINSL